MRRFVIATVVLVALAVGAYFSRPTADPVSYVSPVSAELDGLERAGSELNLILEMNSGGGRVEVVILSAGSVLQFDLDLDGGLTVWPIPSAVANSAAHLTVLVGDHQLESWRAWGDVDDATEVLLGPRTIVADGIDLSLVVVAPGDIYGNAMRAGVPVMFERLGPANQQVSYPTNVSRSIAWAQLGAGTEAGSNSVWATAFGATGVPAVLNEVPGLATSVALDLDESSFPADGRHVVELATDTLVDVFGNELPDGVAGVFRLTTTTSTAVVPATVQSGRLRAWWTAPDSPQVLNIEASVNGQTSDSQVVEALSAVQTFSVEGVRTRDGYEVRVGPLLDPSGSFVADGTEVLIGGTFTATTDGLAVALTQPDLEVIKVSVLGRTVEHRIEP